MMSDLSQPLAEVFEQVFNEPAELSFFSPGRINLIGEHTDYNGGFVFPCAITLGTYAQVRIRQDRKLRLYSHNFSAEGVREFCLDTLDYQETDGWTNYVKGMMQAIQQATHSFEYGLDIAFYGNLPNGAGLSSSASLEMLVAAIAKHIYQLELSPTQLINLGKAVENHYIGVNSGIMDQFAVAMGRQEAAILLDCNTLAHQFVPLSLGDYKIVIMNTNKRRELADSKYNERFAETQQALAELQKFRPLQALCELSLSEFEQLQHHLSSELLVKRARHAISENERTLAAAAALQQGNLQQFGELLKASHLSTEFDYDITGKELDTLVHHAWEQAGVIGARMTGAGFGGCAIAIVHQDYIPDFQAKLTTIYQETIGYAPSFYIAEISKGALS